MKKDSVMNTKFRYFYRDADNYEVEICCVIPGIISKAQQTAIIDSLESGIFFIPNLIGLPGKRSSDHDINVNHPFFEIYRHSFESTYSPATVCIHPSQLTLSFQRCKGKWKTLSGMII